jgi:hypothetical protein
MTTFLTATAVMQAATEGNAHEARGPLALWLSCMPLALRLTRLRAAQLRRLLRDNAWAANAEMRNVKAVWPLHAAIFFSHEPCVALLLRAGANEDAKDCTGRTAMQAATTLQRDAIVALLRADATARRTRALPPALAC